MEMISVASSNISAIGYDERSGTLRIEFTSGRVYEYYDVPQYEFDSFLAAESKGGYGHQNIYKTYRQNRIA